MESIELLARLGSALSERRKMRVVVEEVNYNFGHIAADTEHTLPALGAGIPKNCKWIRSIRACVRD